MLSPLQEDDGLPSEPPAAKPFLPDDDGPQGGAGAGPLPQKEEPRYIHTPGQSQAPPPPHQVSSTEPVGNIITCVHKFPVHSTCAV